MTTVEEITTAANNKEATKITAAVPTIRFHYGFKKRNDGF
jgi:hypothetical protein